MSILSQCFPPSPSFTEKELPDQTGKVALVTGSASGVGLELAKILYSRNATVYIGARSSSRVQTGFQAIQAAHPSSKGRLEAFVVDLADLESVKRAVDNFLKREEKLHVLVHNAGVMMPPEGSKTTQGYDLMMGTNCLAPFLLTKLLEPILRRTAIAEGAAKKPFKAVRVVFVGSLLTSFGKPRGGVTLTEDGVPSDEYKGMDRYMQTKFGDVFLGAGFAKALGDDGILSVSLHPGLMKTELQRNMPAVASMAIGVVFKSAKYGAYTELYAGFSPKLTGADNGEFFIPWGRKGVIPGHARTSLKSKTEGGTEVADRFFAWCQQETRKYL
ncbi:short-chain dehydrogenase [Mytilinidion resinicola]|uniref:Short-chain dehydrogenase n=1 Tax=Mytilinidion resinicola TaxID=574789 RepID=A0A6A6Y9X7_9PEZI|nr:short-chain dehydrogenase [Mytilinidion resinicola]KAF2805333.1 short-chain dehydrogenase [Mytilinidion resinicola]